MVKTVKKTIKKNNSLQADILDVAGKSVGSLEMPKELFDVFVNKKLLLQSVRVYLANQRQGNAATKTRGEVEGSTRKIYKQKGTGKARHGGIRAPIFVGGGIVFGPSPRDFSKDMPKKMKTQALFSALTTKYQSGSVVVVDGLEALEPKTKAFAQAFARIKVDKRVLLVLTQKAEKVSQGSRNLKQIETIRAVDLHPYALLSHEKIVFMKNAIDEAKERFV